ncbi:MAG: O-antigen ligase family protein [Acidimicrobiales bacterium]
MTGRLITDHSTSVEVVNGANQPAGEPAPETLPLHNASFGVRSSTVTGLGAFAAIGAAVLCLAVSPKVNSGTFTPKFAVLLIFAAVGVVPLVRLVKTASPLRWPATAAVAFLAVALVSALVSPSPNIGIFGLYLWGTGWLFWLGVAGAFAIGASLGQHDRQWLFAGLAFGALASAAVAVFQIVANPQIGGLTLYDGTQADAALGNPIHLEALLLGGLALILGRACRAPLRWAAAVLLLSVGLEFTFERFAIVVLAGLILYALYSYGARRGGVFALLVCGGYAIAYLSGGAGLSSRVTSGTTETTFGARIRIWWAAGHYVLHHPLLGAGPGQTRTALDSTATLSFFQHVLVGRVLADSHDVFVEVAVTTGLLGLACFLVWLFGLVRKSARCGFLGFAAALIAVNLVEPLNIAILPLAFLALGAATALRRDVPHVRAAPAPQLEPQPVSSSSGAAATERSTAPYAAITTFAVVAIALLVGVTMVLGDADMARGTDYRQGQVFSLSTTKNASTLLPYWPDSALEVAQVEAYESLTPASVDLRILAESRNWTAVAASRDSRNPHIWVLLGSADLELKQYQQARVAYLHALSCDRWYTQAFEGLGAVAEAQRDWTQAVHWYRTALVTAELDPLISASIKGSLLRVEQH